MSNSITPHGGDQSPFDAIRRVREGGTEFWSARELMAPLGYGADWRNFVAVVDKAEVAAKNQGYDVFDNLFVAVTEKSGGRPREDFHLSRFACYLVAMNGDPRKPEVAAAQAYFAIRTREAETRQTPALQGPELIAAALIESQKVVEQREARIHQLEHKVTTDAPKVGYIDQFVADEDLIKLRVVAANLGVQETWLRNLLIAKRWIYAEDTTRYSHSKGKKETIYRYSAYADKKRYFRPVEVHEAPRFRGEVMHTLKVTPPGAEAIARLVAKEKAAVIQSSLDKVIAARECELPQVLADLPTMADDDPRWDQPYQVDHEVVKTLKHWTERDVEAAKKRLGGAA